MTERLKLQIGLGIVVALLSLAVLGMPWMASASEWTEADDLRAEELADSARIAAEERLYIGLGNNLHLIDSDPGNGFALFRTSKPSRKDMRKFCELGIQEMMVLSGTAKKHEYKYADECPTLKVIYNEGQSTSTPVTEAFLRQFDEWVQNAQATGKKIAFRCECGCHRTGRLAAYYQMKYQGLTAEDAKIIMRKHGQWMLFYPHIFKQVDAMADYVAGRPCSLQPKYCVGEERDALQLALDFVTPR
ncbi:MAG: dual specificity protein phosphatase family protein [Bdellovibrionales bacterium]|nr:dual specificity protein phosphatase family protein [Bdellovibrionales bacterium]